MILQMTKGVMAQQKETKLYLKRSNLVELSIKISLLMKRQEDMILDLLQVKQDPRPITLYWGLRFPSQLFWQDEFTDLAENFPNFHFHPVISKPTLDWNLCSGHVTDCLSIHELDSATGFYLCGNKEMINDAITLLTSLDFNQSQIHFEKYN